MPQAELIDSYNLVDIRSYIYEYIDDSIFIYYFMSAKQLANGKDDIEKVFKRFNILDIYKFTVDDSILILYIPYGPKYLELIKEKINKLEEALIVIDDKMGK